MLRRGVSYESQVRLQATYVACVSRPTPTHDLLSSSSGGCYTPPHRAVVPSPEFIPLPRLPRLASACPPVLPAFLDRLRPIAHHNKPNKLPHGYPENYCAAPTFPSHLLSWITSGVFSCPLVYFQVPTTLSPIHTTLPPPLTASPFRRICSPGSPLAPSSAACR